MPQLQLSNEHINLTC